MKILLLLAQAEFTTGLSKLLGVFQSIAVLVLVASLVACGVNVARGQTDAIWPGVTGAALAALSWVLVKLLFTSIGGATIEFDPQSF